MSPRTKRKGSADASGSTLEDRNTTTKERRKSSKSSQNSTPQSTPRRTTRSTPSENNVPEEMTKSESISVETPQQAQNISKSLTKKGKSPDDKIPQNDSVTDELAQSKSRSGVDSEKASSRKKSKQKVNDEPPLILPDTPQPPSPAKRKKSSKSKAIQSERSPSGESALMSDFSAKGLETSNQLKQSDVGSVPPSKPAPIMDVAVHRLRNFDYHPKPILCMASIVLDTASYCGDSSDERESVLPDSLIAVSRESGSIELQTVHPKWHTVSVVAGRTDTPITALAWVTVGLPTSTSEDSAAMSMSRPALVGVHRHELYIVDFWGSGQLSSKYSCPGGNIFSLQLLMGNLIATGSQDGSIRIYSVVATSSSSDSGKKRITFQFQPVSTIPSAGEAVLSLACVAPRSSDSSLTGMVLFAGIADGTIRRYDCYQSTNIAGSSATARATAHFSSAAGILWKSTLRMTVECYGRAVPTRVWAMKALSDGTLVSGDSLGHIQFWDGHTGTLVSSFEQNDNKADVLALAVDSAECKLFASGVDSRVVCIERQTNSSNTQWLLTQAQRPHTHDVKAMTILKKFKLGQSGKIMKETEIMFTGGIDTKLCTYHVLEFGLRRPRVLYPWPSLRSPILMANEARLLTMLREDRIDLYELAAAPKSPEHVGAPVIASEVEAMLGSIHIKGISNLASSAISPRGMFLAVSDSYSVYLFHVRIERKKGGKRSIATSRIFLQLPEALSVVAMRFAQEDSLVLVFSDDSFRVFSILKHDDEFQTTMTQALQQHSRSTKDRFGLTLPVHSVVASTDGKWIATGRNNYHHKDGCIDVFRRTTSGFQFWWTLPTLTSAVTTFAFLEIDGNLLMTVACIDFCWYTFDLADRRLSDWSMKAGYPMSASKLPTELAARNDFPIRISSNPASPSQLLIGSFGAIVAVDLKEAFPKRCRVFPLAHVRGTKRKRTNSTSDTTNIDENLKSEVLPSCAMCLRYNSMLFMNCVRDNEMVVVEQPWLNVVATFPGALQRKVYGT